MKYGHSIEYHSQPTFLTAWGIDQLKAAPYDSLLLSKTWFDTDVSWMAPYREKRREVAPAHF